MNLLLDIGNSRIKWALAVADELVETGTLAPDPEHAWVGRLPPVEIDAIHAASVAQESAIDALAAEAHRRGVGLQRVRSTMRAGRLRNGYRDAGQLGVDRWLASVAAQARAPGSVLIADAGTALTLDWIAADGSHGGGLIAPGVVGMRAALRQTTQLRPGCAAADGAWLTRDTDSAIANGTLRCACSLLDAAVADLAPDRLLLTGGEASLLAPHLTAAWQQAPHLVLEGLALRAARACGTGQALRERSEY